MRFERSVSRSNDSDVALTAVVIHEMTIEAIGAHAHRLLSSSAAIAMIEAGTLSHTVSMILQMLLSIVVSKGAPSTSWPSISRRKSITGLKNDNKISISFVISPELRCLLR